MGIPDTLEALAVDGSSTGQRGRRPWTRTAHVKATRSACFISRRTVQEVEQTMIFSSRRKSGSHAAAHTVWTCAQTSNSTVGCESPAAEIGL